MKNRASEEFILVWKIDIQKDRFISAAINHGTIILTGMTFKKIPLLCG